MLLRYIVLICALLITLQSKAHSMDNITLDHACEIAQRMIDKTMPDKDYTFIPDRIKAYSFGWLFHIATPKFIKTRDPAYGLIGVGALVVKHDGTAHWIPVSVMLQNEDIEEYLKSEDK